MLGSSKVVEQGTWHDLNPKLKLNGQDFVAPPSQPTALELVAVELVAGTAKAGVQKRTADDAATDLHRKTGDLSLYRENCRKVLFVCIFAHVRT